MSKTDKDTGQAPANHKRETKSDVVSDARGVLTQFIELYQKPSVRNDPVIRTMLRGLLPTSSFETASMAVATLRNAGCLDSDKKSPTGKQKVLTEQPKPAQKKTENTTGEVTRTVVKTSLRGFTRSIDVLLEDSVFRGEYPDKESHPLAIKLRELRKDPNRVVQLVRFKATYKDTTYPNGKRSRTLEGFEKTPDGNPVLEPAEDAIVKDVGDFDLIATQSPGFLDSLIEEVQKKLFSWAGDASKTKPEDPSKIWPSLKGTKTIEMISGGAMNRMVLLRALADENFFRVGPSPTLSFPDSEKYRSAFKLPASKKPMATPSVSTEAAPSASTEA